MLFPISRPAVKGLPSSIVALVASFCAWCGTAVAQAEQQPPRTPEQRARYETGLTTARALLAAYRKASVENLDQMLDAENTFFESLKANGKEGILAAEHIFLTEAARTKAGIPARVWGILLGYLNGVGADWGRIHLNELLRSEALPDRSRVELLDAIVCSSTQPANWLDDETLLPLLRTCLSNTAYYLTHAGFAGKTPVPPFEERFCDFGVRTIATLFAPPNIKWVESRDPEGDRHRNENVEAAKAWVEVRLARSSARQQLFGLAASYYKLEISPAHDV